MVVGQFLRVNNHTQFEHILRMVQEAADSDPALVFSQMAPGFLGELTEMTGPLDGRGEFAFEFYSPGEDANAVSSQERARFGGFDARQIVGLPGFEVAGKSERVYPEEYILGLDARKAAIRAARPRLSFNQLVAKQLLATILQGATDGADPTEGFAWAATDLNGRTITQDLASENANQVATVVANSTQSMKWPLRDGSESATGHDHVNPVGSATWTEAKADTARDLITEHPGNGRVRAICGATIAGAVRAQLKTELGAIAERIPLIIGGQTAQGGYGAAFLVGTIGDVDYYYAPDMGARVALYYASNKKPYYLAVGMNSSNGPVGTGSWIEQGDPELRGTSFGYRDYVAMGCKDPTSVVVERYV